MRSLLALIILALVVAPQRGYSPVQDGDAHGDPPYLLEDGWQPLLNGMDLSGWKACRPRYTTRSSQSYQIWFRAPRFDASGTTDEHGLTRRKKVEPARFLRVLFNGQLVQKDVDVDGPTRAALSIPEAAQHPLMLQGDHGPVAFRNIYVRPLRPLIVR